MIWLALSLLVLVQFFAAAQACSKAGKLAGLIHYAGSVTGDFPTALDGDPAVQARLQRLSPAVQAHLKRNLDVRGPVDLVSCHLVISGNADHMGGEENAILDVNLYSGAVTAAILSHGHITVYLDKDPTAGPVYDAAVPPAVRRWAAMAATDFHGIGRPPPNTEVMHQAQ
ncbi:MAG: hypothetical protein WCC36_00645 [Gammaproteobacteria bacterium]